MRHRQLAGLMLALLIACGACSTPAADGDTPYWPCFHGPQGDNKSTDTGLLDEWPEGGPELLWRADGLGHGYSGISTADGRIFTTGNVDETSVVHCLDLRGNAVWTYENGRAWTGGFPGTRSTPTIDGDRVYDESPVGEIVCLDAASGERVWGLNMMQNYGGELTQWALAESLKIDGDKVICCPFGSKASVVALDKMTGEEVWAAEPVGGKAGYATPTLCEFAGRRIVLTMSAEALVGVDADSGELLFTYPHETSYGVNATDPIYKDGQVFITSGYGTTGAEMLKLLANGDEVAVERIWHNPEFDNKHGGVVLLDGYLYGSGDRNGRGSWMCVDWATGETKYKERGIGMGSLTYADGMLYTMDERRGEIGLVRATPEAYDLVSQFTLPNDGDGKRWAHPVVVGGRLYIRHGEYLYCYDVTAK